MSRHCAEPAESPRLGWQGATSRLGGESDQALGLYEEVLSADPLNVDALRGKAEILNWRGRHEEARELVARARRIAPEDERTITELARADYGLHRYEEARQEMAQVGTPAPETQDLQRGISQALGHT